MPDPTHQPFRTSARYDAVVCDLDGCLGPESADCLDADGLARVAEHNRRAWKGRDRPMVTLCTGRPVPFVECLSRLIDNKLPVMAENGVWLWDPATNVHERDPGITPAHVRRVHEAQDWLEETYGPRGVTQQPGKTCSVSLYHPDHDYLHSITDEVREGLVNRLGLPFRVSATWFYINCDLDFVSKTTAIERFVRRTGIPHERLAGVGDTMPDLKIKDACAWFGCPGNAKDELKPHADFVAEAPMVEGVLEILAALEAGR